MNAHSSGQRRKLSAGIATFVFALVAVLLAWPLGSQAQQGRQLVQNGSQTPATNAKRVALVIGNGAYTTAPPLKNPPNDARDMAATLRTLGFEVATGFNVNQRDLKRLIREFGQKLKGTHSSGLFYYAGHGVQSKGRNYLIPVDAQIESEAEVEDSGVDVGLVMNLMDEAQNGLNIVILDACRNNPFARSFRSASDGLAQVDAPTGTLIAYATAPGRVASDGAAQNGLYTAELLKQMRVPGVPVTEMFMRVRGEVMKQTDGKQVPWEASSLVGSFYFTGGSANAADNSTARPETKVDAAAFELTYWESIKNSENADDYKAYLEKYSEGQFASLAKNRIEKLKPAPKVEERAVPANGGQAEITFWDSFKNSTSADDYRAYLEKYPNGEFAGLARRRLAPLEANEKEKAKADEVARNTKVFVGRYGRWAATLSYNHPGKLIITPSAIQFVYDDVEENKSVLTEKTFEPDVIKCTDLDVARVENEFIREIRNNNDKYRFMAKTGSDALDALAAMRYVCANPGKNFTSAGTDTALEAVDPNAKIFGGYLGVMAGGFTARPGKLIIASSGLRFVYDKGTQGIMESKSDGLTESKAVDYKLHPDPLPKLLECSYFIQARTDGFFIREINTGNPAALVEAIGWGGAVLRFRASSPAEAVSALAAVRESCNKRP